MNKWQCDGCGVETTLTPKVEQLFDEIEEETSLGTGKQVDGEEQILKTKKKVPRLVKVKSMDFSTGEMVERTMQATRDLQPRCYIVKLNAGPVQTIQRDFCESCYSKLLPEINALWAKLESFGSK